MEEEEESPAIGIDLGTSCSCVGIWESSRVVILSNDHGHRTTPSWVAFTHTQQVAGDAARDQVASNPTNTIYDAKRLIGLQFSDKQVQSSIERKCWPFRVIKGEEGKPMFVVSDKGVDKQFSAEQISSMVLVKMKETAERYLRRKVKNAVITVPAYFSNSQRQATIDAGKIAGLNVMRIINEPTAAAIAYALEGQYKVKAMPSATKRNILVFDLGGGTLDVSLGTVEDGIFEAKGVSGDTNLGGVDFDSKLVDYFVAEFKKKHTIDIKSNSKAHAKLRAACEEAKKRLSFNSETQISIDCLYQDIDFSCYLQRERFEMLNMDLFKECLEPVKKCLRDANIEKGDVDDIVLVGGSTRIPMVQQLLRNFFDGKELCLTLNPDEAVANGAAIQAAIMSGLKHDQRKLVDVTPLSLGIEVAGGKLDVIITGNTPIPTTKERKYSTSSNNQTTIDIAVYEGEKSTARDNHLLGNFFLSGITPAPKGVVCVTVTFEIDENSILTVSSKEENTGRQSMITITQNRGNLMDIQISSLMKEAMTYKMENVEHAKTGELRFFVEEFVKSMSNSLKSYNDENIESEQIKKLEKAIKNTNEWLVMNAEVNNARVFEDKLKELQEIFQSTLKSEKLL